jgi:hypothetical protein
MKFMSSKLALPLGLGLLGSLAVLWASVNYAQAQWPYAPPPPPSAMGQRNAMNLVLNQVNWFQNATRTSSSLNGNSYGLLVQQFQGVRDQYSGFKGTLNPQQLASSANQLAELDSGLHIIQEAFADYQTAVANGQSSNTASVNLRQVLNKAIRVWIKELKQEFLHLRVSW